MEMADGEWICRGEGCAGPSVLGILDRWNFPEKGVRWIAAQLLLELAIDPFSSTAGCSGASVHGWSNELEAGRQRRKARRRRRRQPHMGDDGHQHLHACWG
nr:unnamed protein product [Digitaria exilis]